MGLNDLSSAVRALIRDLKDRLAEEPFILAEAGEADYFRKSIKKREPQQQPPSATLPHAPALLPPAPLPTNLPAAVSPPVEPSKPEVTLPKGSKAADKLPKRSLDFSYLQLLLAKIDPTLPILREIPSDAMAKKVATRWKTKNQTAPISILCYTELAPQKILLEEIAKALDVYFGAARLISAESIEKEKQWSAFLSVPELKHVIVCDFTLWQLSDLMRHYKENTAQGTRTLGSVPLFLLPDLSLYLKDPLLKRFLWRSLCQKISS